MPQIRVSDCISRIAQDILKVVLYYDIFSYPLNEEEIYQNSGLMVDDRRKVNAEIDNLIEQNCLFRVGSFISVQDDPGLAERRLRGNQLANKLKPVAKKMAARIASFPYVRAVFVSGSLSKNYMDEAGDVDFFVITDPGRLWLSRTLLVLYKKIFLLNSHKYFCVNYFIDTDHLEIEEKNLFTATEVITLLPFQGANLYQPFLEANKWVENYYPVFKPRTLEGVPVLKKGLIRRSLERIFDTPLGGMADEFCMRFTLQYWKRKFSNMETDRFEIALKSRKYVSKHHPSHFQEKVLDKYTSRLESFSARHGLNLGE